MRYNRTRNQFRKKGKQTMPRMLPPKGYIRSKEAQDILKVSPAMIRYYVQDGKIKHFVPNGRTQGFYLESDVKKLANELSAIFDVIRQETNESVKFVPAKEMDVIGCIELNKELFPESVSADNETIYNKWVDWIQKNPEIIHIIKSNKDVSGIIMTLPFKPKSKKFEEILMDDVSIVLGDVNISSEDIEEYKAGNHVQLYMAEIGVKPSLEKNLRRKYGRKLIYNFANTIVNLGKRGVIVENIIAVGETKSGVRLLQHFGFNEVTFPRPDTRVFTLDMKNSGALVSRQYRQALKEYRQKPTSKT
jgi:hypothetical protein